MKPLDIEYGLDKEHGKKDKKPLFSSTEENEVHTVFNLTQLRCRARRILIWNFVPRKHALVVENRITRNIRIKKTGPRIIIPFLEVATQIKLSDFSMKYQVNPKDGGVTTDGIDVHGTVNINCCIDDKNIRPYYDQEFANKQLEVNSKALINEFLSNYKWEQLKQKKIIEIDKHNPVYAAAKKIAENYGIKIISIDTTGIQAPEDIANMEERLRTAQNEYNIQIQKAKADLEIRKLQNMAEEAKGLTEARIEGLKGTVKAQNTNKLIETLLAQGFDAQQALEFLKRSVTSQNSVLIEGNGTNIDQQTLLMAMSKLQDMANNTNTSGLNNDDEKRKVI